MRRYMTTLEAAAYLRRSPRAVQELTRLRKIPCRKLAGTRAILFVAEELDQFADGAQLETTETADGGFVVRPVQTAARLRSVS
jgi:excisionase family DNA binding protein